MSDKDLFWKSLDNFMHKCHQLDTIQKKLIQENIKLKEIIKKQRLKLSENIKR